MPITNLPVNAISEEADPTLEIRTLIEQLQQAARDARNQVRTVEQERDGLASKLENAADEIEELRAREHDLRSHFTEVSEVLKERDLALVESERQVRALAETQEKLTAAARERNDAQRQRDDAVRQRDELQRRLDAASRSAAETGVHSAEVQKQILAIRQARDAAHAQNLDLSARASKLEDEIAELEYQCDTVKKAQKQALAEASEFRRQLDAATLDRDATARQVEQLTLQLDEQRRKLLDLAEQKASASQSDSEHLAALAEARIQVQSLTEERDAARNRAQEQSRELEEIRAQFQTIRDSEAQAAASQLTAAQEKSAALEAQTREHRHTAANLRQQLLPMGEKLTAAQEAAQTLQAEKAELEAQLTAHGQDRDSMLASLDDALRQLSEANRERDSIRELAEAAYMEAEAQIAALRSEACMSTDAQFEAEQKSRELAEVNARFEKQRLETIDLAAQVQAAQMQIRELSATLAEARLQVKFAQSAAKAARTTTPEKTAELVSFASAAVVESQAEVAAFSPYEPVTEKEARGALGAMRHCFQSFTRDPNDLSLLNELYCHVHGFAERARTSNFTGLYRLCHALAELTHGLYEIPEQINPSTLRTVNQTIDFLGSLIKVRDLATLRDPATARIYAVDDDLANCECIQLALQEQTLNTTYAQEPAVAMGELAGTKYDLILLDVNLPGMDGFELCKHIREMHLHTETPIVFLTALATLENRVQSSLSGGNDFIAKPFNLHELSVKTLTLILKAQLQLA